jgi:hypothetical protein
LLRFLKTGSNGIAARGLLDWTIQKLEPLLDAMNRFPYEKLGDFIQDYSDTEKFVIAFDDERFGQCKETFSKGPEYWCKLPGLRAKWKGINNQQIGAVMEALSELGYDKDLNPK